MKQQKHRLVRLYLAGSVELYDAVIMFREMIAVALAFLTIDMEQFCNRQFNINLWYSLLLH